MNKMRPKFPLGATVITPTALNELNEDEVRNALQRHHCGDWGHTCDADREENELSLKEGHRLFSVYYSSAGRKFWIITECDRSVTTVLMPEDY